MFTTNGVSIQTKAPRKHMSNAEFLRRLRATKLHPSVAACREQREAYEEYANARYTDKATNAK